MTIGSLFDGSGTAPLAATILGGAPLWASEIEPYPVAVTRARFPNMIHLGSITEINGAEVEPVDVIVGGSPCQDLSIAGKQAGLESGTRSNLFYEMTRIIREMRGATNGKYPRFVVWENVPGAFSSNKGRDFLAVVEAFCAVADDTVHIPRPAEDAKTGRLTWKTAGAIVGDGWSFAWRVLDAQYWGVPQRRRRIFAVLDLGSERAGEILFERAGLPWDSEPRGETGQSTSSDAVGRTDGSSGDGRVDTLCFDGTQITSPQNGNNPQWNDPCHPLAAQGYPPTVIVREKCDRDLSPNETGGVRCLNPWDCQSKRIFEIDGIYPTLPAMDGGGANNQAVVYENLVVATGQANAEIMEECSPTLNAAREQPILVRDEVPPTMPTRRYIVRRLTPLECCRLQGFSDWWTDGVPGSDTAKYKMWGNGMALPCMLAVLSGIKEVVR